MIPPTITRLPPEQRCSRCRQHRPECAEWGNYNLCLRCQDVLHHEHNNLCVGCGTRDETVTDNLCPDCRAERIAQYDQIHQWEKQK